MQLLKSNLVVKPSQESFEFWLNQPSISASARQRLGSANVLITPRDPRSRHSGPLFHEGSMEFLNYCNGQNVEGLHAALCLGDEDYREILLISYDLFLPDIIVERVIIPIYVKVMNGYLSDMLKSGSESDIRVSTKVTAVEKDESLTVEFSYRGNAADYEATVASTLKLIRSPNDLKLAGKTGDLSVEERINRLADIGKP